jgi:UDPglucose 6-dehydrogenase
VGTAQEAKRILEKEFEITNFEIVSCPEFLAEGSAIRDLISPQRVVIGTSSLESFEVLKLLSPKTCPIIRAQDTSSSELGKLLANAMLA